MVSVLVVHSSLVGRDRLVRLLAEDDQFQVEAAVAGPMEALAFLARRRPDVVTMEALGEAGLDAVRRIMETTPVPIIAIAGVGDDNLTGARSAQLIEAGAVAVVAAPPDVGADRGGVRARLKSTVRAMAGIKVVRRWPRNRQGRAATPPRKLAAVDSMADGFGSEPADRVVRVIAIGVSTGGPPALQAVLSRLPAALGVPVLIVQHIARGFVAGLAEWLNQHTPLEVRLAVDGEVARADRVYLAPDGFHMGIDRDLRIALDGGAPEYGMRPAVSHLFRSVADTFGSAAVGVLMTGMGRDGALELKLLHDAGAVTIAQDKESCVVFGMSAEAIKLGAARYVLTPDQIGVALSNLAQSPAGRTPGPIHFGLGGPATAPRRAEAGKS